MSIALRSPRRGSAVRLLLLLGLFAASFSAFGMWSSLGPAGAAPADDEAAFMVATNNSRASAGLAALAPDPDASNVARAWSAQMASRDQLFHNPNLQGEIEQYVTASWQRIGENVGVGYTVPSLQDAFMGSPGHRANILGDYNRLGVGVTRDSANRLWVALVFIKGPALPSGDPFGSLDAVTQVPGGVRASGWAIDPGTSDPIEVHVYVDSSGMNLGPADDTRLDVAAVFPSFGPSHGYDALVPANPGWHRVCAYGINIGPGSNRALGCRTVLVSADPFGAFDAASQRPEGLRVSGWAIDPETADPIDVHVYVDSAGTNIGAADDARPDVEAVFKGYGSAHGYDAIVPAEPGWHRVCVYGINVRSGANRALNCKSVLVGADPFGSFEAARQVPGGLSVSGWAVDPETADPISVHVYVGSTGTNLGVASGTRVDVGAVFQGYGSTHGFDGFVPAAPGWHQVCAYGINVRSGANRALGCRVVLVAADPVGSLEAVTPVRGGVQVSGWTIDPETADSIEVHVYVDADGTNLGRATGARYDVEAVFRGYGATHGYDAVVPIRAGPHRVCAYGINVGPGANRPLGCRTVLIG